MTRQFLGLLVAASTSIGMHQAAAQTDSSPNQIAPTLTDPAEKRCGWLENPSPANYWLTYADGELTVSIQGSFQAEGFFDLPASNFEFHDQWVSFSEGRSYGYGCACLEGLFDRDKAYARQVIAMQPLSLEQCRADPNLPPEPTR